jgi:hypothetical protein
MPKQNEPLGPPPVSPPPLPPDFPDIPQNPPSALQPAPDSVARPDKVEGTTHSRRTGNVATEERAPQGQD